MRRLKRKMKVYFYAARLDYQAQLREVTLQEENAVYESTISCENKIQEKIQEEDLLKRKLMTDSLHTLSVSVILDSVLPLLLLKKPNCRTSLLFTSQPHHTKVQDKRRFDEFQLLERSWFLGIFRCLADYQQNCYR
ncbi:uncharacterized protein [Malus domestica]